MNIIKGFLKYSTICLLILFLSGFTSLTEKVPPPKSMPKRTTDKNAGIVIPSFDASPYEIIEKSYDPLSAFMYDDEKGIFVSLTTSNFDLKPHKLTFHHKKYGFITYHAYRVRISYIDTKKPQKLMNFSFSPFEITSPKTEAEVRIIADSWVRFFDSLGWKRSKQDPDSPPFGSLPEYRGFPYMIWKSDGFELTLSLMKSNLPTEKKYVPKFYLLITFIPDP